MTRADIGGLLVLGALWGASFLFMRIAAPVLGAVPVAELRVLFAGGALVLLAYAMRSPVRLRGYGKRFLVLGTVNAAIPFVMFAFATSQLPASLASIFNSTTPMFTAILAWAMFGDALDGRRIIGLFVGLAGVGLLVGWSPVELTTWTILGIAACFVGSFCYAIGGIYASRNFAGQDSMSLSIGQQLGAGVVLLPLALAAAPQAEVTGKALLAVLGLALASTAFAYLIYFRLLRRIGPLRTTSVTYLVPGFGVLWGWWLLDETITVGTVLGLLTILAGVALLSGVRLRRPARAVSELPTS